MPSPPWTLRSHLDAHDDFDVDIEITIRSEPMSTATDVVLSYGWPIGAMAPIAGVLALGETLPDVEIHFEEETA